MKQTAMQMAINHYKKLSEQGSNQAQQTGIGVGYGRPQPANKLRMERRKKESKGTGQKGRPLLRIHCKEYPDIHI